MNTTKTAATLMIIYAVSLPIYVAMIFPFGRASWYEALTAILPLILLVGGSLLIARGILRLKRWGWWAGVAMGALSGASAMKELLGTAHSGEPGGTAASAIYFAIGILSTALSVGAAILLLLPSSRAAFFRNPPRG